MFWENERRQKPNIPHLCGSWKHKHTRLFGFHPHCSTLLIHQANIKAAHQKLFSLLSSLFLRDLAEGEREKRGKILVYLKASLFLMALRGDLGHSKFGETILLPVTPFSFFVDEGVCFVLMTLKNVIDRTYNYTTIDLQFSN